MELAKEDIDIILKQCTTENNYQFLSCERHSDYVPIGFLSAQSKLSLKYQTDSGIREVHLFIKKLPESKTHRDNVISCGAFTKEVMVFQKFLIGVDRKESEGNWIPTCYLARDNEVIVLNDLSHLGFANVPLQEPFTRQHCEKAIESLVKLHTSSLLFEAAHNCNISQHLPELKQEILFTNDETSNGYKSIKCGIRALREVTSVFLPDYSEDLKHIVFDYMDNVGSLIGPSSKYPNVLSHSDLWGNNLMFRSDEKSKVVECSMVDFQLATVKPISYDLQMLLHLCTDKQTREKHRQHFLEYYYQQLTDRLSSGGVEVRAVLGWSEYLALAEETRPLVLAVAPQYLHFILMPDTIIRDVMKNEKVFDAYHVDDRASYVIEAAQQYPAYKARVIWSLTDIFEYFKELHSK